MRAITFLILIIFSVSSWAKPLPFLKQKNQIQQLIVDGKPYLIQGGELGNSSASRMSYMLPIWPKLKTMKVNTVLAPVYWELIEPQQGKFDFRLLDELIVSARQHDMKLVLLWFGSWKNSMSSYAPPWLKRDFRKFARARAKNGQPQEILTPFSPANLAADIAAFSALMAHVKEVDSQQQTVLMIQVENEIGMLPSARDHHPLANDAFTRQVPSRLVKHLEKNKQQLQPHVKTLWANQGYPSKGDWQTIFGQSIATDEIFMAWHFAQYVNQIVQAGKKIYNLPMFVNAALNRPDKLPGEYPSAGPLPHVFDVWQAGAADIDFFSPDFYNPRFRYWSDLYARQNALFIPEIRFDENVGAKSLFTFGHYHGFGFSPFSIESGSATASKHLAAAYTLVKQIEPYIHQYQGTTHLKAALVSKAEKSSQLHFSEYLFNVKHDLTLGWSEEAENEFWQEGAAIIVQLNMNEFIVSGTNVVITFSHTSQNAERRVGIEQIFEGEFIDGKWHPGRSLNGDQSHQGRHLRIPYGRWQTQKLTLYSYQ